MDRLFQCPEPRTCPNGVGMGGQDQHNGSHTEHFSVPTGLQRTKPQAAIQPHTPGGRKRVEFRTRSRRRQDLGHPLSVPLREPREMPRKHNRMVRELLQLLSRLQFHSYGYTPLLVQTATHDELPDQIVRALPDANLADGICLSSNIECDRDPGLHEGCSTPPRGGALRLQVFVVPQSKKRYKVCPSGSKSSPTELVSSVNDWSIL